MLRFRRLRLKNWKNFESVDIDLRDRMFLVGPNASGKSNLLDAFRFLRDLVSSGGGFAEAVRRREGVSTIRCLAARRHSDIEIGVELRDKMGNSWSYELAFNQDNQRRPVVRTERVLRDAEVIVWRPDEDDRRDAARLTQTHLEQVNANLPFRDLTAFFASIRYLHIVPQLVREPDRSVRRSNDPFGGDFLAQVARTTARTQDARMKRIREAVGVAVPQLDELELTRDVRGVPHLRARYQHWRQHGAWQSERQLSDGTLRLLGLLWATLDGGGPLLLEEPQLSLHPEIVRVLPQMLARVQRRTGRQIFLSTHSPDLLRDMGIGLDETLLFAPKKEGTRVSPATSEREIGQLLDAGLSLAEIVIPRTRPADVTQLALFADA
ncbi:AAA family ATPase [Candidatus Palauibacter sp.]|uniref:AAA family ATPase n=1 Tax=Candidatus Palauibacter sp. TaxID=3101350 RepID=UPI003CC6569C